VCDWEVPKFEIGYWARTSQTGHGYITEAVNGVVRLAIDTLGANRLEIRCDTKNDRSAAVAKRVGFVLEGTLRCDTR
jgi:RimJ/RimL family protein N-acetyltransferase